MKTAFALVFLLLACFAPGGTSQATTSAQATQAFLEEILAQGWIQIATCAASGITCNDSLELTTLYLGSNQLTGTIPDLSGLTALQELYLSNNQLTGTIPDLSGLTALRYVYLDSNQLTGTIPDFSGLTALQSLYLSVNQLTGTIPDLSGLTALRGLGLNSNQLTGTFPDISELTALQSLYINNNHLSALAPTSRYPLRGYSDLSSNPYICPIEPGWISEFSHLICDCAIACVSGLTYEVIACTPTSNRTCTNVSAPCGPGTYESTTPSVTQDRVCSEVSSASVVAGSLAMASLALF